MWHSRSIYEDELKKFLHEHVSVDKDTVNSLRIVKSTEEHMIIVVWEGFDLAEKR